MTSKGFTENTNNIETPNDINVSEKPLNTIPSLLINPVQWAHSYIKNQERSAQANGWIQKKA